MKDSATYIDLMIAACQKIADFTGGLDKTTFLYQEMAQSAVIMQLQVLGEMAKKLDETTKQEIKAPWSMIIGLRNIISHDYFALDLMSVWNIAVVNVSDLESKLHAYLKKHNLKYLPPFSDTTPLMG